MRLFVHRGAYGRQLAVFDGGDYLSFDRDALDQKATVESVFYGRVQKIVGAFALVDMGLERPGILNKPVGLKEGDKLFVQIKREAFFDKGELSKGLLRKGEQLTQTVTLITPCFMYFPHQKGLNVSSSLMKEETEGLLSLGRSFLANRPGKIIFRSKALTLSAKNLLRSLEQTAADWEAMSHSPSLGLIQKGRTNLQRLMDMYTLEEIYTDHIDDFNEISKVIDRFPMGTKAHFSCEDVFASFSVHDVWAEVVETPWIRLPSGGQLLIEYTSTLTSIDVNQGTCSSLKVLNHEAARRIPKLFYQLQLSGNIIVDFAGDLSLLMRKEILGALKKNLPIDVSVCTWSHLGWLEVRRPKTQLSLMERMNQCR